MNTEYWFCSPAEIRVCQLSLINGSVHTFSLKGGCFIKTLYIHDECVVSVKTTFKVEM